jgi:hypothetical protein
MSFSRLRSPFCSADHVSERAGEGLGFGRNDGQPRRGLL